MTEMRKGMAVVGQDGNRVGTLETILSDNETNVARFLRVDGHLLPIEAVQQVEQDKVMLRVPQQKFREFPDVQDRMPSQNDIRAAYDALGERAPGAERP